MAELRALTDSELDAVSGAGYSYKKVVIIKKGGDGGRGGDGGDGGYAFSGVNVNKGLFTYGDQVNNTSADGGDGGNGGRGGDA